MWFTVIFHFQLRETKSVDGGLDTEMYEPRQLDVPQDNNYKLDTKAGSKFYRYTSISAGYDNVILSTVWRTGANYHIKLVACINGTKMENSRFV